MTGLRAAGPTVSRGYVAAAAVALVSLVALSGCDGGPTVPSGAAASASSTGTTGSVPSRTAPFTPPTTIGSTPSTTSAATATRSPTPIVPTFVWEVRTATAADLGSSWHRGCPIGPESLRVVAVSYWTFEGRVETGELVLNAAIAERAQRAFARLFELRFPIRRIRNVAEYASDDSASMAADNTSGFNCRLIGNGSRSWSNHAYGRAIDVNPVENPDVLRGTALPPAGAPYLHRADRPGLLVSGGPALAAFTAAGFSWGGRWSSPDYQHVEIPR